MARAKAKTAKNDGVNFDLGELFKGSQFTVLSDATWGKVHDYIPFGLPALDAQFLGGAPLGRFVEVYSPENVGKSTLAVQLTKMCIELGVIPVWIDIEGTTDKRTMEAKGVDTSKVLLRQPTEKEMEKGENVMSIEGVGEAIQGVVELLSEKAPKVPVALIWDSIGQTSSEAELNNDFDSQQMGLQSKAITKLIRKVAPTLTGKNILFLGLNQARDKIGGMSFVPQIESTGGRALRHYASVRLELKKGKPLQVTEKGKKVTKGHIVRSKAVKSKISNPQTMSEPFLYGEHGLSTEVNAIYEANLLGIISGKGDTNIELSYTTDAGEVIKMKRLAFYDWSMQKENFPIVKEIFTKVLLTYFPDWFPPLNNENVNVENSPWYSGLRDIYTALGKSEESLVIDPSNFDQEEGEFDEAEE